MKIQGTLFKGSILVLALALIPACALAAATAGAKCAKAGATEIVDGKQFTCIESGRNLVWDKGVAVPTSTPTKFDITPDYLPLDWVANGYFLAEAGGNVPKTNPTWHVFFGQTITAEVRAYYDEWMRILIKEIGGYDRWVQVLWSEF